MADYYYPLKITTTGAPASACTHAGYEAMCLLYFTTMGSGLPYFSGTTTSQISCLPIHVGVDNYVWYKSTSSKLFVAYGAYTFFSSFTTGYSGTQLSTTTTRAISIPLTFSDDNARKRLVTDSYVDYIASNYNNVRAILTAHTGTGFSGITGTGINYASAENITDFSGFAPFNGDTAYINPDAVPCSGDIFWANSLKDSNLFRYDPQAGGYTVTITTDSVPLMVVNQSPNSFYYYYINFYIKLKNTTGTVYTVASNASPQNIAPGSQYNTTLTMIPGTYEHIVEMEVLYSGSTTNARTAFVVFGHSGYSNDASCPPPAGVSSNYENEFDLVENMNVSDGQTAFLTASVTY